MARRRIEPGKMKLKVVRLPAEAELRQRILDVLAELACTLHRDYLTETDTVDKTGTAGVDQVKHRSDKGGIPGE